MKRLLIVSLCLFVYIGMYSQELDWVTQIDQTSGDSFQDKVRVNDIAKDKDNNVFITEHIDGVVDFDVSNTGGIIESYYGSSYSEDTFVAKSHLQFVKNDGQIANHKGEVQDDVFFNASVDNANLFFTNNKVIFVTKEEYLVETEQSIQEKEKGNLEYAKQLELNYREYRFQLKFINANPNVKVYGQEKCSNYSNYYLGHCQDGIKNVPHFYTVYYEEIYPNIDLKFYSNEKGLKFDFIVKPGGDPNVISYTYEDVENLEQDEFGNINVTSPFLKFTEEAPYSFITEDDNNIEVKSSFNISETNIVSFSLEDYPKDKTLVIDPTLDMVWSTYFDIGGSSTWDNVVFNSNGDFYASCYHYSSVVDVYDAGGYYQAADAGGSTDLAIIKFSNLGAQVWTTYYGGSGNEYVICNTTAIDGKDNLYVGGETSSKTDFPLQDAGGYYDGSTTNTCGFLLKFDDNCNRLWSTYIGASGSRVRGITTSSTNDVYIVGSCYDSAGLPVQSQGGGCYYQSAHGGGGNGYIMRFNTFTSKLWCTYFGGDCYVDFIDIHIDPTNDNLYCVGELGGWSAPTSYPSLINPGGGAYFDNTVNGKQDLFIARFNSNRTLTWSTIYGGQYNDNFNGDCGSIDTDSDGNFYFCGKTASDNLPIQNPGGGAYYQSLIGGNGVGDSGNDGYSLKFNSSGVRQWATFYGGSGSEEIRKLKIDNNDNVWIAGYTNNSSIPLLTATGHYNQTFAGSSDAFIARFTQAGVREWASCLGGSAGETCRPFAIYEPDSYTVELFMVDYTASIDFPTVNPGGGAYYLGTIPTTASSYISKFSYKLCQPSTAPTSISGTTTICSGSSTTLTAVGGTDGTGATYQWYAGGCGSGSVLGTGISLVVSPTSNTTYYVRRTGTCGTTTCASVAVTVNTLSTSPISISGTSTICNGSSTTLTAVGGTDGTGATYQWYAGGCGSGSVLGTGASLLVSPSSTTTYYVRRTGTCNTTSCTSVTVTVNTLSTAPTSISGTSTICNGSSTTLTAVGGTDGTGATYQWYAGGCGSGSVLGTGASLLVSPSSTTTYYVRRTGTCNTTSCTSVTVTVNTLSTAPTSISGTSTICNGSSTTLTAVGGTDGTGATYQWYAGGCGSGSVLGTGASLLVSPTSTTTYYVRRTGTCNTTSCTSVTVTVNMLSTAPTSISGTSTICNGSSTTLTAVGGTDGTGATYQWYAGGCGSGSVLGTGASLLVSPSSTTTYYVRRIGTCNTTSCTSVTVTVNTLSTAPTSISGTSTICNGSSTTLTAVGGTDGTGATYQWYAGGCGSGSVLGTGASLLVSPTSTTTYFVRRTGTCNTTSCTSVTVTVNTLSTAPTSISGTSTICNGSSTTLTAVGGTDGAGASYQWYAGGCGSGSVLGTGASLLVSPTSTTTYFVRRTGTCNTTSCTSVTVTVNTLSTAPTSISGTSTICNGSSTTLTAVGGTDGTGATYQWYAGGCGSGSVLGTGASLLVSPTSTTTYYVRRIGTCNTTSCTSVTVNVNTLSTAPTSISGTSTICNGSSTTLTAVGGTDGTGASYQWYAGGCGSGSVLGTGASLLVSPTSTTTYYVRRTGTCNTTSCINIEVVVDPIPTVSAGGSQTICSNETATVSGASSSNGTILWTEDGVGSITVGATTLTPTYTAASGDAGNTVTLTMTVTSDNSCNPQTVQATYTVDVDPLPTANAGGSQAICSNETATVSGASSSNGTVLWTEDGAGSITSGATALTPTYTAASGDAGNTVTLTMTVTSDNSCNLETAQATYTVDVDPLPVASAGGSQIICSNGTAIVSGASSANGTILWTEDGVGSITSGATTLTPTYTAASGDAGNTVTLTMTVTGENSCNLETAIATYTVNVDGLPTAAAGGSQTICSNGTAVVSGATATNGNILWSHDGNGLLTDATTLTPSYTADALDEGNTVTLTMTVTSDNSCNPQTAQATYTVDIDALPTALAGGSQTICPDGTAVVSGASSSNGTILWTHDGAGSISDETGLTPTYNADVLDAGNTVSLTMTVSSSNTCAPQTEVATYTVNVGPLPTAPTLAQSDRNDFCGDDAGLINLSVIGGTGDDVHWFDDVCGGNEIGVGNPLSINSPTATITYYVRWENTCGASACESVTVNVAIPPVAATSVTSDINDICADDSGNIELSVIGGSGTTVQWFTTSCGGTSIGSGNPLSLPSPDVTTTYYAYWESPCGVSTCAEHTVNVLPLPVAPTSADVDRNDFCSDDSGDIELTVTGGSGDDVHWYTESCGGTSVGTGNPLTIESPTATTTYYARWENSCGQSSCEFVIVNVVIAPEAPTFVSSDRNDLCVDDAGTINLSAVGGSGATIHWYTGTCQGTEIGTTNPLNIESPTVTTEYFALWENSCGMSSCESVTVTIIDAPTDPISANVDIASVCEDDAGNISLSITGGSGPEVYWYSGSCGGTSVGMGNPLVIESPTGATTYFARYESACGNSNCVSVDVAVNLLPTSPTTATSDLNNICSNDDGNISLSITGGSGDEVHWFDDACGGNEIGTGNPLVIPSPENTITYYARWENSCGISTCQSITVITVPAANATIDPAGPFCATDGAIVLTAADAGGTWSGTAVDPVTGLFDPATAGVGDHLITYSISGICPDSDDITISVVNSFDPTIDAVSDMCSDELAITLTAADTGGTWFGTGIIDDVNGIFDPSVAGVGDHTITYGSAGGCGGTDDAIITVNAAADATITPVGPFCEIDDPIVVTAAQIGGTWSGTSIDPITGFFDPEVAGAGDHIISYTITGDCEDNNQITIVVSPNLDATIDDVSDMCTFDSEITLTAANIGGEWSGVGITDTDLGTFDPSVAGVGTHTITYTFSGACGSSDDIDIEVNLSADATITPVGPFCETDDPLVVTAAQIGGTWSGTAIDPVTGFFDPEVAGIGDHVITYTITGACGDSDEITISVLEIFDATIDEVDPMCEKSPNLTLTAATDGGTWSGDGIIDPDLGTFDPTVAGQGTHVITYEFGGDCGSSDDVTIEVIPSADASITAVGPFCEDANPLIITAAESGGVWSGTGIDPTTGFFDPEIAGIGDHLISYEITGECGDSDQITVSILEYFDATITGQKDYYCFGDSCTNLVANTTGGVWTVNGDTIPSGWAFFENIGVGTHEIIYSNDGLCGDADTVSIVVYPDSDAIITPVDTLTDEDDPVELIVANEGGIWEGLYVDNLGFFKPVEAGADTHQVIYTIDGYCGDSDTLDIVVIPGPLDDLVVPTVITPDNDGYNDRWRIQGIEEYNSVSIRIFTRWGDEVFIFDGSGTMYEDPINQWDGTRNDTDLPTGQYVFVLVVDNDETHKGTISLIR